ncbi:MAG: hypothetical protein COB53_09420 [Elusimicrobia bacterium]|nr:MAG: hypothetical protein COB53_09420 [Elusimicrobiota bacterium]
MRINSFIAVVLLAAPAFAGGPTSRTSVGTTGGQTAIGKVTVGSGQTSLFNLNTVGAPGLPTSSILDVTNHKIPGARYDGAVAPGVMRQQDVSAAATKLTQRALSDSGINTSAFSKNSQSPTPGAPIKTEETGIAAIDGKGGLAQTVQQIAARKQPGAGGVALGTNRGDLDRLFEQIGKRSSSKQLGLPASQAAVALKEVEISPEAQVKNHAAQAVRSIAEAHSARLARDRATQLQRVSEAGQFMIQARAVVKENNIPSGRVKASFSAMNKAAVSLGSEGITLLADAAISAAGRAKKNEAFDYANQMNEIELNQRDGSGVSSVAGYSAVLSSLKRGLAQTVARTSANTKETFAPVEVEEFSGTANPRMRVSLPDEFVPVTALDETAFVDSMKIDASVALTIDEQIGLAAKGMAMFAAMKFGLNTQGFMDNKRSADAALAKKKTSNPFGMRGFLIAARKYISESFSGVWQWLMSMLERFGLIASADAAGVEGTIVTVEALASVRADRSPRRFSRAKELLTTVFGPYTTVAVAVAP